MFKDWKQVWAYIVCPTIQWVKTTIFVPNIFCYKLTTVLKYHTVLNLAGMEGAWGLIYVRSEQGLAILYLKINMDYVLQCTMF